MLNDDDEEIEALEEALEKAFESTQSSKKPGYLLLITAILLSPIFIIWQAYVAWILWGWFIQPLGAPDFTMWQIFGVLFFWRWATSTCSNNAYRLHRNVQLQEDMGQKKKIEYDIIIGIITPTFGLGCGWVFHTILF